MQICFNFQGLEPSPWAEQFIRKKSDKLSRYLGPGEMVEFHIKLENQQYLTTISLHHKHKVHSFSCTGMNLFESFSGAIDKASRVLSEDKRRSRGQSIGRHSSLRDIA